VPVFRSSGNPNHIAFPYLHNGFSQLLRQLLQQIILLCQPARLITQSSNERLYQKAPFRSRPFDMASLVGYYKGHSSYLTDSLVASDQTVWRQRQVSYWELCISHPFRAILEHRPELRASTSHHAPGQRCTTVSTSYTIVF